MSERKVLNKYYPPDYDPSKIPRARRPKNRQWNIRTMAPFNMRCNTCGEYIYKGKKFNSRQELAEGETYLGLKIFRFYIRCPKCVSEITFKTDPESVDYKLEAGATRNFEALRTAELMAAMEAKEKEEELENNPMKMLENRTKASQREMDMLETLEDLRELNSKHSKVDLDQEIEKYRIYEEKLKQLQDEEDERFIESVFCKTGKQMIKRLPDGYSDDDEAGPSKSKILKTDNPTDVLTKETSESADNSQSTSVTSKTQVKGKAGQKNGGLTKSSISMMIKKKKPENKSESSVNCNESNENDAREAVSKEPRDSDIKPQSSANCGLGNAKVTMGTVTKESEKRGDVSTCNTVVTPKEDVAQKEITENVSVVTVARETSRDERGDNIPQASGLSLLGNYSDTDSSDGSD